MKSYFTEIPVCALKSVLKDFSAPAISCGPHQEGTLRSVFLNFLPVDVVTAAVAAVVPAAIGGCVVAGGAAGGAQLASASPALVTPASLRKPRRFKRFDILVLLS